MPTAIECGETFRVKVGIKCGSACKPDGWAIEVRDHAGNAIATAAPGSEPWSGTAALYYAEVRLAAPDAEGLYAWEAFAPAVARGDEQRGGHDEHGGHDERDGGHQERDGGHEQRDGHGEAGASFNVRAVPAPECRLTVVALDKESQSPVRGAKVVVHPYRAVTDERGVAEMRLPKGVYRLFVSGRDYLPFRSDGEVAADATITAELESDSGPSDAELWS